MTSLSEEISIIETPDSEVCQSVREAELLSGLRQGQGGAFEEMVRTYSPRMLVVIRRYLPQEQDCHDALQDAFLSVFRAVHQFKGESALGTWLHRIAVNAALMRLRSAKRRHERPIDDLMPRFLPDGHRELSFSNWAVSRGNDVEQLETRELVRHCIDQLPESYRTILILRDIEEYSTDETGELLGLGESNVKIRLHRARLALRELLDMQFQARAM